MQAIRSFSPLLRAFLVIGAVAALVTSITFANLSNTATLADNQFTTATAELKIWDPVDLAYEDVVTGFNFTNVVPGTPTLPFTFWLKNDGGVPLDVTVVSSDGLETGITNNDGVDFTITNVAEAVSVTYSYEALIDGTPDQLPGTDLDPAEEEQYTVSLLVDGAAVTGSSASITDMDWTFTGTQP